MQIRVFASSSAGNCTLVRSGRTAILIDCGLGPERMREALKECGLDLSGITGVLVTHTHSDHLHRGMVGALRRAGVPLVCAGPVADAIGGQLELFGADRLPQITVLERSPARIGTLEVEHFLVPHDAPGGCYGFVLRRPGAKGGKSVALATDIGHVEADLPGWLSTADLAIVESNHDLEMLLRSGRPEWLIRRIRTRGHLSNDENATLVRDALALPRSRLRHIVLAHLSEQCNTPAIALRDARRSAAALGMERLRIDCAPASVSMPPIDL